MDPEVAEQQKADTGTEAGDSEITPMETSAADPEAQTEKAEGDDNGAEEIKQEGENGEGAEAKDGEEKAEGDDQEKNKEEAPLSKSEMRRRYAPENKERLYSKYVNKALGRMYESRIVYVGPLQYKSLQDERVVSALEKAQHSIVRYLHTVDPPRFCVIDLVFRQPETATEVAASLNGIDVDGWKLQALVQSEVKKLRGDKRPYMIYFIDFEEFKRDDVEELADLNLHHSFDRMEKLWAYIENLPASITEAEVQGAIPNSVEVVLPHSEEGRVQGYGYTRFMTREQRDEAVEKCKESRGFEVNFTTMRIYPIESNATRDEGKEGYNSRKMEQLERKITHVKNQLDRERSMRFDPYSPPGGGRGGRGGKRHSSPADGNMS